MSIRNLLLCLPLVALPLLSTPVPAQLPIPLETRLSAPPHEAGSEAVISAELWSRPRSGASLLAMPMLSRNVSRLLRNPDLNLIIHHPGGEEGSLWAEELRDWLVALGMESARINLRPGGQRSDQITLSLGRSIDTRDH